MYARNHSPQYPKREESGGAQSFRRGSYNIPASYAGNAFSADFSPTEEELKNNIASDMPESLPEMHSGQEPSKSDAPNEARLPSDAPSLPVMGKSGEEEGEKHGGFLGDLLSKFDHGFEMDDLLLIGLILLLSRDSEKSGDTLILLAILFFMGL